MMYDVIVVGAGLAGLSAAWALRARNVLVLEREKRIGGRVLTRLVDGVRVDLGAVFALSGEELPGAPPPLVPEEGQIGLLLNGRLRLASTPARLTEDPRAFFHVIHPGPYEAYNAACKQDAWARFPTHRHARGNCWAVEALAGPLRDRIGVGVEVTGLTPRSDRVLVHGRGRREGVLEARAVICAAPAPVARGLLQHVRPAARKVLDVPFVGGSVVAIGFKRCAAPAFTYVATPQHASAFVLRQCHDGVQVFLVYVLGDAEPDVQTARTVLADLEVRGEEAFVETRRWPYVGPVISDDVYGSWEPHCTRPSERVVLAGDYTSPETGRPYGMTAALRSGRRAAHEVEALLADDTPRAALTDAWTYCLGTDTRFIGRREHGAIAPYGNMAPYDAALARWLLTRERDGLWEWDVDLGPTAEDTALVLEGVLASAPAHRLQWSAERLIEAFWTGTAFETVRDAHTPYWRGPSVDATALCGWLLARICTDPALALHCTPIVLQCKLFVGQARGHDGMWRGRWFPSARVTTWYSVRFLHLVAPPDHEATRQELIRTQAPDGSWDGLVIDTAAAVLTLDLLGAADAVRRGRAWLAAVDASTSREPVLYYAMAHDGGATTFAHCTDRGPIAAAWKRHALEGGG